MKLKYTLFIVISLIIPLTLFSQAPTKKSLDHADFDLWKRIRGEQLSNDGAWITYTLTPGEGDPTQMLYHAPKKREWTFRRSKSGKFAADNNFFAFLSSPPLDTIKNLKRKKTKDKDMPGDTLVVFDMDKLTSEKYPQVKSFKLPEKWDGWLAFLRTELPDPKDTTKNKKEEQEELVILNLKNQEKEVIIPKVKFYEFAEEGQALLVYSEGKDSTFTEGIYLYDCKKEVLNPLFRHKGTYKQYAISKSGKQVAFVADLDTTEARIRPFQLFFWNGKDTAQSIASEASEFLPDDWMISEHGKLNFSEDEKRLFFGSAPKPVLQDTSLLPEEIVKVEVWSYKDTRLYTQQNVLAEREKKRNYLAVYNLNDKQFAQLANPHLPTVRLTDKRRADIALAYHEETYLPKISWEGFPSYKDVYLVDVTTGDTTQVAKEIRANISISPKGNYLYWYTTPDSAWYAYSVKQKKIQQLTSNSLGTFYNELNDVPNHPYPYGTAGWMENDEFVLVYDRYDIWKIDPQGQLPPENLTNQRVSKTRYRYINLDPERNYIEKNEKVLLHFRNEETLEEGYAYLDLQDGSLEELIRGDLQYTQRVRKAKDADRYLFTRENYQLFPDLLYGRSLDEFEKISNANPQQANYNWGTIEHVEWISANGEQLKGLLVKPENFDPSQKYPMIVNFYEKNSQNLHRHRAPMAHRSTINYPFYASRGYLIFNPDVPYRDGYPGESAYNAVVSGVTHLINQGFVDAENIGLQGHSWGGYQVAYLITRTDLFKCAESGAPVVNMTSAYGGIRWGSGLSRMFQYEHTQSRIGGTLWEYPMRYLENSPLFFTDKVNTPVLILHNDKDGAVPWYQGIEYFVALRRLGKPAWLLNYNDEPHWPVKRQNRKDFQKRMQQFFDYYLKDDPLPKWMKDGVSPLEKGILQGYELLQSEEKP